MNTLTTGKLLAAALIVSAVAGCATESSRAIAVPVAAGLGVTVRTSVGMPAGVRLLETPALPPLPHIGLSLLQSEAQLKPVAQRLREIVLEAVAPALS